MNAIGGYVALLVVFAASALTLFTKDISTVQIVGLLASGAVIGICLERIALALKAKPKPE